MSSDGSDVGDGGWGGVVSSDDSDGDLGNADEAPGGGAEAAAAAAEDALGGEPGGAVAADGGLEVVPAVAAPRLMRRPFLRQASSLVRDASKFWGDFVAWRPLAPAPVAGAPVVAFLPAIADVEGLPADDAMGAGSDADNFGGPHSGVFLAFAPEAEPPSLALAAHCRRLVCDTIESFSDYVRGSDDVLADGLLEPSKGRMLDHYLMLKRRQIGACAEAEQLEVGYKTYDSLLQASACACVLAYRERGVKCVLDIHEALLATGAVPLVFTDHLRYDETPMRSCMVDPERPVSAVGQDSVVAQQLQQATITATCVSTHTVKILQTQRWVSLLYKHDGGHLAVRLPVPVWLQSLADGKGETYARIAGVGVDFPR